MLNIFKKLFKKEDIPVKKGEVWYCVSHTDAPFGTKVVYVRIKDVMDGWVNYKMGLSDTNTLFQDEVMKKSEFVKLYKKQEENVL